MTKLIAILFIAVAIFVGWKIFQHYEQVKNEEQAIEQTKPAAITRGEQLEGMPHNLMASYQTAEQGGLNSLRSWMKTYGGLVQDPRKGWIELEIAVMTFRENPTEARRSFAAVRERTPPESPLWPKIKQLQATFDEK